jgi:LytS/YehU family sensor histidine kinase
MIAPMLFIPFVENAFKYVADKKKEKSIDIWIIVGKDELNFICENTYQEVLATKIAEGGGIGAALIQKRLSLLYPNHQLKISRSDYIYRVEIIISIHEL